MSSTNINTPRRLLLSAFFHAHTYQNAKNISFLQTTKTTKLQYYLIYYYSISYDNIIVV